MIIPNCEDVFQVIAWDRRTSRCCSSCNQKLVILDSLPSLDDNFLVIVVNRLDLGLCFNINSIGVKELLIPEGQFVLVDKHNEFAECSPIIGENIFIGKNSDFPFEATLPEAFSS
jgi:hypothetical protein